MAKRTSIAVYKETANRLRKLGTKGETYDALINRLIDLYENRGRP